MKAKKLPYCGQMEMSTLFVSFLRSRRLTSFFVVPNLSFSQRPENEVSLIMRYYALKAIT